MKSLLSRIFSKNLFYKLVFVLLILSSIAYVVPSFTKEANGKFYIFKNLPSLFERSYSGLKIAAPKTSQTIVYKVESLSKLENEKDWNTIVAEDQKTLERRVEAYTGDDYEIELKNEDGKAVFYVYTLNNIPGMSEILTRNNSDFRITKRETTEVTTGENAEPTAPKETDLSLGRQDFGFADIVLTSGQTQGSYSYMIKMPIGLIGPEKLNRINENLYSSINVFVGGKDYQATFLSQNATGYDLKAKELTIQNITDVQEARALKAFLNTSKFGFGYELKSTDYLDTKNNIYKLLSIFGTVFLFSCLLNLLVTKNLSLKKIALILGYTTIALGLTKLFGVEITDGYLFLLGSFILLSIFNSKWTYYLGLVAFLIVIKITGYLYFINLEWTQILVLTPILAGIYLTNNIKIINKKYV